MWTLAEVLLAFVALWPVCTAAIWVAGGLVFRIFDERHAVEAPAGGWPGVTVLIPAFNEEAVIATSVAAAIAVDYPEFEVLVLDDGSTDATEAAALDASGGDARCRVLRDPVNRGKADRLNFGFSQARHEPLRSPTPTRTCIPQLSSTWSLACLDRRSWPRSRVRRTSPTEAAFSPRCRCWRRRRSSA